MTEITDEQVAEWAKEASKHALIKWFAKAAKESPGFFRRFAELARQDEREACVRLCEQHVEHHRKQSESRFATEAGKIASGSAAVGARGCLQAIRARGSDK